MNAYNPGEWLDDFLACTRSQKTNTSHSIGPMWAREYFSKRYKIHEESEYRRLRFVKAMAWLETHAQDLDFAGSPAVSSTQTLVTIGLVNSLWRLFANIPDDDLKVDPPFDLAIAVVKETMAANPSPLP